MRSRNKNDVVFFVARRGKNDDFFFFFLGWSLAPCRLRGTCVLSAWIPRGDRGHSRPRRGRAARGVKVEVPGKEVGQRARHRAMGGKKKGDRRRRRSSSSSSSSSSLLSLLLFLVFFWNEKVTAVRCRLLELERGREFFARRGEVVEWNLNLIEREEEESEKKRRRWFDGKKTSSNFCFFCPKRRVLFPVFSYFFCFLPLCLCKTNKPIKKKKKKKEEKKEEEIRKMREERKKRKSPVLKKKKQNRFFQNTKKKNGHSNVESADWRR